MWAKQGRAMRENLDNCNRTTIKKKLYKRKQTKNPKKQQTKKIEIILKERKRPKWNLKTSFLLEVFSKFSKASQSSP